MIKRQGPSAYFYDRNPGRCYTCLRPWETCADEGDCTLACHSWHACAVLGDRPRGTCPYHRGMPPT